MIDKFTAICPKRGTEPIARRRRPHTLTLQPPTKLGSIPRCEPRLGSLSYGDISHFEQLSGFAMKIRHYQTLLLSAFVLFFASACQQAGDTASATADNFSDNHGQAGIIDPNSKPTILQIAVGSPDHTTLAAGVVAAELQNVLSNPGPLTVFAPNNAAFDKLPAGTLEELLKPKNKAKLGKIITSHASPGTFKGDLLKDGDEIYLATGQYVDVEVRDGDTYVNGAKILGTVDASNGVVHVVDTVFLFDM